MHLSTPLSVSLLSILYLPLPYPHLFHIPYSFTFTSPLPYPSFSISPSYILPPTLSFASPLSFLLLLGLTHYSPVLPHLLFSLSCPLIYSPHILPFFITLLLSYTSLSCHQILSSSSSSPLPFLLSLFTVLIPQPSFQLSPSSAPFSSLPTSPVLQTPLHPSPLSFSSDSHELHHSLPLLSLLSPSPTSSINFSIISILLSQSTFSRVLILDLLFPLPLSFPFIVPVFSSSFDSPSSLPPSTPIPLYFQLLIN